MVIKYPIEPKTREYSCCPVKEVESLVDYDGEDDMGEREREGREETDTRTRAVGYYQLLM